VWALRSPMSSRAQPLSLFSIVPKDIWEIIFVTLVDIPPRISEIESKKYDEELDKLMDLDTKSLRKIYQETQTDKRVI